MKYLVANWKCQFTKAQAKAWVEGILTAIPKERKDLTVIAAPGMAFLENLAAPFKEAHIELAAQNLSPFKMGPYTGEVAGAQLADIGVQFVFIGHSERRSHFGERASILREKVKRAKEAGLGIILCFGEDEKAQSAGKSLSVIEEDLGAILADIPHENILLAYEPIWAIGSGKVATLEQIEEVSQFLRAKGYQMPFLYGGSVDLGAVEKLIHSPHINGLLVGSASLNFQTFANMAQTFLRCSP